jgi:hypothetical protein
LVDFEADERHLSANAGDPIGALGVGDHQGRLGELDGMFHLVRSATSR